MADLTLKDLLDSGVSLEELLFNKEPVEVNVTVDTKELMTMLQVNQQQNAELIANMEGALKLSGREQKDVLVKALGFLMKNEKEKSVALPPITGLKVIRDENDRIDMIKFIRE